MIRIEVVFKDKTTWSVKGEVTVLPGSENLYIIYENTRVLSYINRDEVKQITIRVNE